MVELDVPINYGKMALAFAPYIKALGTSPHTKLEVLKTTSAVSIGVGKVDHGEHVRLL